MNPDGGLPRCSPPPRTSKKGEHGPRRQGGAHQLHRHRARQGRRGRDPERRRDGDFDATFTVDDKDRLSKAVLTGPFYPKADAVTYTITFDDYGTKPTITKP